MNKTAIKNFAIWARRKLISDITYKAGMLGVSENGIAQPLPQSTRDLQFFDIGTKDYAEVSGAAIEQRNALVKLIRARETGTDYKTAFRNVVEEVAYTWFNRLIAVRFMEVNDYLPSHIRVLSSESEGKLEPDFVTMPFDTDLEFSSYEKDRVYQLKDENKLDELFRMLFIKQCNKLSEILPGLFEQISDYTELLLNISFTDKDGIVYHLTHDISEDEFNVEKEGQVEIIGWMYQYYNTEPKDEVFALLKKNVKITKERIPAATQLFTPDWIVRYMVENSLGRLWVEGHPNEQIKTNWKYYLEEAEQEPDVVVQLNKIREEYAKLSPTDIKVIDPCMGSGHILVYAFDVLMQIYTSQGYIERDAAKSILENNLFGIDIDVRAYQLAYFAVMMKARQYNRKIFQENITQNLIAIRNPEDVSKSVLKRLGGLEPLGLRLIEDFEDAEEYGSILQVNYTEKELQRLEQKLDEIDRMADYGNLLVQMESMECCNLLWPLIKQARLLSQKYDVVVTNPPYMNPGIAGNNLLSFVRKEYPDSSCDMYAVFVERIKRMLKLYAMQGMITQHTWMFIGSYENFRKKICKTDIINMAHLGARAFDEIGGEVVQTTAFVLRNGLTLGYKGRYARLVSALSQDDKEHLFLSGNNQFVVCQKQFSILPGTIIGYWVSPQMIRCFEDKIPLDKAYAFREGIHTSDNEKFLRYWFEVSIKKIVFECSSYDDLDSRGRYVPYNKGGAYRKWYGNNDYVIGFDKEKREEMAKMKGHVRPSQSLYFKEGGTWSSVSTGHFGIRYYPTGFLFDAGGQVAVGDDIESCLAFLNSSLFASIAVITMPTINFKCGVIKTLPDLRIRTESIRALVRDCICIAHEDWDYFETSWDFVKHPLLSSGDAKSRRISDSYEEWNDRCCQRFLKMKADEEDINKIFIEQYDLQNEMDFSVEDEAITLRRAELNRDIRSLISYAVGCMFGRYSLDVPGLAYAGGEWDVSKYSSIVPDVDNCIPITDTEYFHDDIVGRFVEFVRVAYGDETLEENLQFVASALGNKGNTSREVIRNYFLNDFYKDHLKVYQKRPIYWLFDSGKQNGFKALVYMHRWNADTVGNLRIEYLHKMQAVYEHELETCQEMIDHGQGKDVAVATKQKEKLVKQLKECMDYDAKIAHIAFSKIDIDLDDGVKVNYRKVQTGSDGKFCEILANSKDVMAKEK